MTTQQKLLELTAEDGPNVPMQTLAIYCGTSSPTLSLYVRGKRNISQDLEKQIEKGLREYAQLLTDIVNA